VVEQASKKEPVVRGEGGLECLASQDGELVPPHQDLDLLVAIAHRQQTYQGQRVRER
jgi:hypothetical protein